MINACMSDSIDLSLNGLSILLERQDVVDFTSSMFR